MNDWSESYIKLEQLLKASRDAFNQERYDDALSLSLSIEAEAQKLQNFAYRNADE